MKSQGQKEAWIPLASRSFRNPHTPFVGGKISTQVGEVTCLRSQSKFIAK